jgi:hypothetical protein
MAQVRYSYSESERVVPRITINDVLLTSDHPFRSVLKMTRGEGYAQYGGFPVIIESNYHISKAGISTTSRDAMAVSAGHAAAWQSHACCPVNPGDGWSSGPTVTQEVIGAGRPTQRPDA